jgi:hypothetical protein
MLLSQLHVSVREPVKNKLKTKPDVIVNTIATLASCQNSQVQYKTPQKTEALVWCV